MDTLPHDLLQESEGKKNDWCERQQIPKQSVPSLFFCLSSCRYCAKVYERKFIFIILGLCIHSLNIKRILSMYSREKGGAREKREMLIKI